MARVGHKPGAGTGPGSHGQLRGPRVAKHRKKQKMEVVTEDKDKHQISFTAEPPPGYTFIPAGNPQLTAALKEFAKKSDHQILAVTTTPHAARHELSREVHRVGYHFPTTVVAQVCTYFGIQLTSRGTILNEEDFFSRQMKNRMGIDEKKEKSQVDINTEAKQIIKDLFPKIPDNDLFQIIKTAFQLGDHRVGTAEEIPLVRRAQLSVVAHIRHVYTKYDKLLRQLPYNEARHKVEAETLKKLVEWRGDQVAEDDAVNDALNDAVVVISDDEETDSDVEEGQIVSEKTKAKLANRLNAQLTTQVRPLSPVHVHSDEENVVPYRVVPQPLARREPEHYRILAARHERDRYAAWARAREEYRDEMANRPTERVIERVPIDTPMDRGYEPIHRSFARVEVPRVPGYASPQVSRPMDTEVRHVRQPSPVLVRGTDGMLYERIVHHQPSPPPISRQPVYVSTRPPSPVIAQSQSQRRTISFDAGNETIVPSIEAPHAGYSTPPVRRHAFEDRTPYRAEMVRKEPMIIDLTNTVEQASKRPRLDYVPSRDDEIRKQRVLDAYAYQHQRQAESRPIIDLTSRAEQVSHLVRSRGGAPDYDNRDPEPSSVVSSGPREGRVVQVSSAQMPRERVTSSYRAEVQPSYVSLPEDRQRSSRREQLPEPVSYQPSSDRMLYNNYNETAYAANLAANAAPYSRREVVEVRRPIESRVEASYPEYVREQPLSHVRREYIPVYEDPPQPIYVSHPTESTSQRPYVRIMNGTDMLETRYETGVRYETIPQTTRVRN